MQAMWIKSRHVASIISIALVAASTDVHAQYGTQSHLLFNGIAAPWQIVLTLGICVGLLISIAPCIATLLDVAARAVGSQDTQQNNNALGRFMLFMSCLAGGLLSAALISGKVGAVEIGTILVNETWMPIVWGLILILSALSLFGLYQIRIPDPLLAKYQRGHSPSVVFRVLLLFVFGFLPVLVLFAIFAPLFIPVSVMAESTPFFAVVLIFVLAWSVLLVTAPKSIVPIFTWIQDQASDWKLQARHLLGVLQIAAVIHLLGMVPDVPVLLLWGLLLVVTAVFLGATQRSISTANSSNRLLKGAGIAVMVWGGVVLVGASAGNRDITDPLPQLSTIIAGGGLTELKGTGNTETRVFTYVTSADQFEQMLTGAKAAGRPVLLDFYADWCLDCKRMDRSTFKDPTVVARLRDDFLALKIDVTDPEDEFGRDTRKRFGVFGPPALVLFDRHGNHLENLLAYGYLNTNELLQLLSKIPTASPGAS